MIFGVGKICAEFVRENVYNKNVYVLLYYQQNSMIGKYLKKNKIILKATNAFFIII